MTRTKSSQCLVKQLQEIFVELSFSDGFCTGTSRKLTPMKTVLSRVGETVKVRVANQQISSTGGLRRAATTRVEQLRVVLGCFHGSRQSKKRSRWRLNGKS